jgi:hypothetical protein
VFDSRDYLTGTDEEVARVLEILGDSSEWARTWVMATLDDDEGWFNNRSDDAIRLAYRSWRRKV